MGRYATGTSVAPEKSEMEIKRTLQRYGATKIGVMTEARKATIYFEVKGRDVQWSIPLVVKGDPIPDKRGYTLTESGAQAETRRRWRVMVLTIKALLEGVDSKVMTFDEAFLAHVVIPGTGKTIGDALVPRLDALATGGFKALMSGEE